MVKVIAIVAGVALGAKLVARELPGMRRYQKISTM
jgi:hypothetical protein